MLKPDVDPEKMIEHVRNRPFNDMRYFLDLRQLESLGWKDADGKPRCFFVVPIGMAIGFAHAGSSGLNATKLGAVGAEALAKARQTNTETNTQTATHTPAELRRP